MIMLFDVVVATRARVVKLGVLVVTVVGSVV